jgi:predicted O-linked N-acetylglucosamine transferase (SPINDLY family)
VAGHAFLLGASAHALNDIPAALAAFATALQREPGHADAACALGSLLAAQGRLAAAEALFRRTLALGEHRQLRFNLAVVLEELQRPPEAEAEYSCLLALNPDDYAARHNRAALRASQMRLHEAAADYRELITRHPQQTLPWQNLADLELSFGHYEKVLELLAEVRQREPENGKALLTEALALAAQGSFEPSAAAFQQLQQLDAALWQEALARVNGQYGQAADIEPRLIYLLRQHEHREACDWSGLRLSYAVWQELDAVGDGELMPLSFRAMNVPVSAAAQLQLARRIAAQTSRGVVPRRHQPGVPKTRLRVGYCSPDFGQFATGVLVRRLFAQHDPARIEPVLITLRPDDGSAIARDIRASAAWLDLSALDDAAAAARIAALELDVLVSLAGYSTAARPGLLAHRPAPVQVSWLAMPSSTGADYMDYFISDARVRPEPDWCSEAEVLLPDSYFLFSHDHVPPQTPPRQQLGLPDDQFVFCCLNASYKHEADTFGRWMELLHACPQSVLWLLADNAAAIVNLRREADWRGINPQCLLFAPRVTPEQHLARLGAADLFLDTRYVNGHTTVAEALWSGLPVLTCAGDTFASRVGHSLVHSCGLGELSVGDWDTYSGLAQTLYADRPRLARLRTQLAENRLRAAPFDLAGQARALEAAYFKMHQRFCAGLPPAGFTLT